MLKFEFDTAKELKNAQAKALIKCRRGRGVRRSLRKGKEAKGVHVGKSGSIVIPAKMASELGFGPENKFNVQKSRPGIALKKIQ